MIQILTPLSIAKVNINLSNKSNETKEDSTKSIFTDLLKNIANTNTTDSMDNSSSLLQNLLKNFQNNNQTSQNVNSLPQSQNQNFNVNSSMMQSSSSNFSLPVNQNQSASQKNIDDIIRAMGRHNSMALPNQCSKPNQMSNSPLRLPTTSGNRATTSATPTSTSSLSNENVLDDSVISHSSESNACSSLSKNSESLNLNQNHQNNQNNQNQHQSIPQNLPQTDIFSPFLKQLQEKGHSISPFLGNQIGSRLASSESNFENDMMRKIGMSMGGNGQNQMVDNDEDARGMSEQKFI